MTPQGNKPSSHDVIIGRWSPSQSDRSAGRLPTSSMVALNVVMAEMIGWLVGLDSTRDIAIFLELAMDLTWIFTIKVLLLDIS
ncbi:hypothetical protein G4B88_006967 [Cannabis sativa]|uniref:Glycoside hydrolase family 19 catalytic domain-containing protein n=1 Tax=Cannabis sativa TaxID=3483 RepID=A0A7J6G4A2_CANSA|nr:hypothetical protein G4B88_006967 [Cannabis sativa]